jgi:energy-coupling factor transporter ATP-binding protein EcfA2
MGGRIGKWRRKGKLAEKKKYPPAYFHSISVENLRCFGPKQTLNLFDKNDPNRPAQWTVLLGDNGVGKTTLLQALVMMAPVEQLRDIKTYPPYVAKFGVPFSSIHKNLFHPVWMDVHYLVGSKLSKESEGFSKFDQSIVLNIDKEYTCDRGDEQTIGLLVYGYGGKRRFGEHTLGGEKTPKPFDNLINDDVALLNAEEWLLRMDYALKSENVPQVWEYIRKQQAQIEEVLSNVLPEISNIQYAHPPVEEVLRKGHRVEFETPYGWVPLSDLSLGYKSMIAWIVDFSARMFERYNDSDDPLSEPAVVLVDEFDLHLHPKWQRKLMKFLSERFVNTQFIVTAHSPLIVLAADEVNANIAVLKRVDDHVVIEKGPDSVRGWSVDQLMSSSLFPDVDSGWSLEVEELLKKRRKILAKSKLSKKDRTELDKLEEEIGYIPVGQSENDIEAMEIIQRIAEKMKSKEGKLVDQD